MSDTRPRSITNFPGIKTFQIKGVVSFRDQSIQLSIGCIKKGKKLPIIFIFKKPDTFQKAKQFPLHCLIQRYEDLNKAGDSIYEYGYEITNKTNYLHSFLDM